jgi:hypothetical protein
MKWQTTMSDIHLVAVWEDKRALAAIEMLRFDRPFRYRQHRDAK